MSIKLERQDLRCCEGHDKTDKAARNHGDNYARRRVGMTEMSVENESTAMKDSSIRVKQSSAKRKHRDLA